MGAAPLPTGPTEDSCDGIPESLMSVRYQLRDIAQLISQREVVEGDEAMDMASSPMLSDMIETAMSLGEQLRSRYPDQELVTAVYDTQEREGHTLMVPVKVVYMPKSRQ